MKSPPRSGNGNDESADAIVSSAARRALGARRRLRFVAIVLWSGFLGAVALLLVWLALAAGFWPAATDLSHLSRVFFVAWAASLIPAASAALLARPHESGRDHG